MPRFYRDQFASWQPKQQVFQVLPSDLTVINGMVKVMNSIPPMTAQCRVESAARAYTNGVLWFLCNGGIPS